MSPIFTWVWTTWGWGNDICVNESFNTNSSEWARSQLWGKIPIPLYEVFSAWCLVGTFWSAYNRSNAHKSTRSDCVYILKWVQIQRKPELNLHCFCCPVREQLTETLPCRLTQTFISFKIIHTNAYSHKHFFLDSV